MHRILPLNQALCNQIAAGEVIERPASVVKELLENSLDAQSSEIKLYLYAGGLTAIHVVDNGHGVHPDDFHLVFAQHATSKITTVEQLNNIFSLGFRGEALASIASVARVNFCSRQAQQEKARQLMVKQGQVGELQDIDEEFGTKIQVMGLFENIPARKKFLRSERTEYYFCEEVFRRIALSCFAVSLSLFNGNKLVKSLPSCPDNPYQRIKDLCGKIAKDSIAIDVEQNGLRLYGWLGNINNVRSQEVHQYFFVNNRAIKDRLVSHAIKVAMQQLGYVLMPFYCLYLAIDGQLLDVNVHPTKHEVRFMHARVVHAFIQQAIINTLKPHKLQLSSVEINKDYYSNISCRDNDNKTHYQWLDSDILFEFVGNECIIYNMQKIKHSVLKYCLLHAEVINKQDVQLINLYEINELPIRYINYFEDFGINITTFPGKQMLIRSLPKILLEVEVNWQDFLLKCSKSCKLSKQDLCELLIKFAEFSSNINLNFWLRHDMAKMHKVCLQCKQVKERFFL